MCLAQEVKAHCQAFEAGEPIRYRQTCPHCTAQGPFRLHDCPARTFRLIVDSAVRTIHTNIGRWRCGACGKRFRDYPRLPCRTNSL